MTVQPRERFSTQESEALSRSARAIRPGREHVPHVQSRARYQVGSRTRCGHTPLWGREEHKHTLAEGGRAANTKSAAEYVDVTAYGPNGCAKYFLTVIDRVFIPKDDQFKVVIYAIYSSRA